MTYIINIDPAKGKMFGANLYYLPPTIREGVANSLINKAGEWRGLVPEICLHTYFIANCGQFYRVPAKEWKGLSRLPVQDFRNQDLFLKSGQEVVGNGKSITKK